MSQEKNKKAKIVKTETNNTSYYLRLLRHKWAKSHTGKNENRNGILQALTLATIGAVISLSGENTPPTAPDNIQTEQSQKAINQLNADLNKLQSKHAKIAIAPENDPDNVFEAKHHVKMSFSFAKWQLLESIIMNSHISEKQAQILASEIEKLAPLDNHREDMNSANIGDLRECRSQEMADSNDKTSIFTPSNIKNCIAEKQEEKDLDKAFNASASGIAGILSLTTLMLATSKPRKKWAAEASQIRKNITL